MRAIRVQSQAGLWVTLACRHIVAIRAGEHGLIRIWQVGDADPVVVKGNLSLIEHVVFYDGITNIDPEA